MAYCQVKDFYDGARRSSPKSARRLVSHPVTRQVYSLPSHTTRAASMLQKFMDDAEKAGVTWTPSIRVQEKYPDGSLSPEYRFEYGDPGTLTGKAPRVLSERDVKMFDVPLASWAREARADAAGDPHALDDYRQARQQLLIDAASMSAGARREFASDLARLCRQFPSTSRAAEVAHARAAAGFYSPSPTTGPRRFVQSRPLLSSAPMASSRTTPKRLAARTAAAVGLLGMSAAGLAACGSSEPGDQELAAICIKADDGSVQKLNEEYQAGPDFADPDDPSASPVQGVVTDSKDCEDLDAAERDNEANERPYVARPAFWAFGRNVTPDGLSRGSRIAGGSILSAAEADTVRAAPEAMASKAASEGKVAAKSATVSEARSAPVSAHATSGEGKAGTSGKGASVGGKSGSAGHGSSGGHAGAGGHGGGAGG